MRGASRAEGVHCYEALSGDQSSVCTARFARERARGARGERGATGAAAAPSPLYLLHLRDVRDTRRARAAARALRWPTTRAARGGGQAREQLFRAERHLPPLPTLRCPPLHAPEPNPSPQHQCTTVQVLELYTIRLICALNYVATVYWYYTHILFTNVLVCCL